MKTVIVLGASEDPSRYANKAIHELKAAGHQPIPVNPKLSTIEALKCYPNLTSAQKDHPQIDTLTVYVNPRISSSMKDEILALKPRRIIFNPGSENAEIAAVAAKQSIHVIEACTLVLLRTNQFDSA